MAVQTGPHPCLACASRTASHPAKQLESEKASQACTSIGPSFSLEAARICGDTDRHLAPKKVLKVCSQSQYTLCRRTERTLSPCPPGG